MLIKKKGGKTYIDLVKSIEYLESNPKYSFIDFDNAVALGSSFGGCQSFPLPFWFWGMDAAETTGQT